MTLGDPQPPKVIIVLDANERHSRLRNVPTYALKIPLNKLNFKKFSGGAYSAPPDPPAGRLASLARFVRRSWSEND